MIDQLQQLVPNRVLTRQEALAVAERQAARLRQLLGVDTPYIATEQLESIPGLIVEPVSRITVSGATQRIEKTWIILTNRDEAAVRQRFTIAHELKHILDDASTAHQRARNPSHLQPAWLTERICDYFAACLLMPRLWVKRAWAEGDQTEERIARLFNVSLDAARIRLQQIGLTDQRLRCPALDRNVIPLTTRIAA